MTRTLPLLPSEAAGTSKHARTTLPNCRGRRFSVSRVALGRRRRGALFAFTPNGLSAAIKWRRRRHPGVTPHRAHGQFISDGMSTGKFLHQQTDDNRRRLHEQRVAAARTGSLMAKVSAVVMHPASALFHALWTRPLLNLL